MERIAQLRKEKGLNQTGLELKLNTSQSTISSYESGMHQPSIEILLKLSKIFHVSVDYLIGNSDLKPTADTFLKDKLTKPEAELLDLFRALDQRKQKRAIGIIFALKNYKSSV